MGGAVDTLLISEGLIEKLFFRAFAKAWLSFIGPSSVPRGAPGSKRGGSFTYFVWVLRSRAGVSFGFSSESSGFSPAATSAGSGDLAPSNRLSRFSNSPGWGSCFSSILTPLLVPSASNLTLPAACDSDLCTLLEGPVPSEFSVSIVCELISDITVLYYSGVASSSWE